MSRMLFAAALLALLPLILGCQEVIYPTTLVVPFSSEPGVVRGNEIMFNGVTVGRVGDIAVRPEGVRVTINVTAGAMPDRGVLLATTNRMGQTCLQVYAISDDPQAARGPYWGATSDVELAVYLGQARAQAIWHSVRGWLLDSLATAPRRTER